MVVEEERLGQMGHKIQVQEEVVVKHQEVQEAQVLY